MDAGTECLLRATVVRRATDHDGNILGRSHRNPLLDTRQYEVEFADGTRDKYFANTIAENIYAQVDDEGHHHLLLKEIIDHKKSDSAITVDNGFNVPGVVITSLRRRLEVGTLVSNGRTVH